ncbi:MAG: hypothetical protein V7749_12845 [Cocleimonas sp.]
MRKKPNNNNVPTVTNLVAAGNPIKKAQANKKNSGSSHLDELNQRIDEIEEAIGQDNSGPVGRAFAIRAETNKVTKARPKFMTEDDLQKVR